MQYSELLTVVQYIIIGKNSVLYFQFYNWRGEEHKFYMLHT